jgi:hypothetical protein
MVVGYKDRAAYLRVLHYEQYRRVVGISVVPSSNTPCLRAVLYIVSRGRKMVA